MPRKLPNEAIYNIWGLRESKISVFAGYKTVQPRG